MLKAGLNKPEFIKEKDVIEGCVSAFPEYKDAFEEFGFIFSYYIVENIEEKILTEIKRILSGEEGGRDSAIMAQKILKLANEMSSSTDELAGR